MTYSKNERALSFFVKVVSMPKGKSTNRVKEYWCISDFCLNCMFWAQTRVCESQSSNRDIKREKHGALFGAKSANLLCSFHQMWLASFFTPVTTEMNDNTKKHQIAAKWQDFVFKLPCHTQRSEVFLGSRVTKLTSSILIIPTEPRLVNCFSNWWKKRPKLSHRTILGDVGGNSEVWI